MHFASLRLIFYVDFRNSFFVQKRLTRVSKKVGMQACAYAIFLAFLTENYKIFNKVVIVSHTDCILQQLVVILTVSNTLIGSQYDYQLNYYL